MFGVRQHFTIAGLEWHKPRAGVAVHHPSGVTLHLASKDHWEVLFPTRDPGVRRVEGRGRTMGDAAFLAGDRGGPVDRALAAKEEAHAHALLLAGGYARPFAVDRFISLAQYRAAQRAYAKGEGFDECLRGALAALGIKVSDA